MGFLETLAIAISTVGLHHSPTWVGVIVTMIGVTGLVGGLRAGAVMKRIGPGFLVGTGLSACAAAALLMAVPDEYVVLGAAGLFGLGLPFAIVGAMSAIQLFTPNELMGRVSGVDSLIVSGLQVIGISAGAALISIVYYRDLCYLVAGTLAASAVFVFTRKAQRTANLPPYAQASAAPTAGTADASERLNATTA
jgi:predicted MFS family arabinose efflux permease